MMESEASSIDSAVSPAAVLGPETPPPAPLHRLFAPRGVAVMGVSTDPTKLGSRVYRNLIGSGYTGACYAIGRNLGEGFGAHGVGSIADMRGPVDVVFLALPATLIFDALESAAVHGVGFAIIGSSGFAESGDLAGQARLRSIAKRTGIRIVGPNCNGIFNAALPLSIGFNRAHGERWPAGGISILSHSGALFHPLMRLLVANGSGLASFVSAGNEDDLTVIDYAEHLVDDAQTRVIAFLIDAVADVERLRALALRAAARGKSIVVLKLGSSALGAMAAVAHSSRLTGQAEAYDALFASLGIATATTIEGLIASAAVLDRFGPRSGGLAVLTTSGAGGAMIADHGSGRVAFAQYSSRTIGVIESFRQFSHVGNPTDVGVFRSETDWPVIADAIARDSRVGVILAYFHSFGGWMGDRFLTALAAARHAGVPVLACCPGGLLPEEKDRYRAHDLMVLSDTDSAIQAAAALLHPPIAADHAPDGHQRRVTFDRSGVLGETGSLALLEQWGVPCVPFCVCSDGEAAVVAAERFGYPVVAKALVEGEAHKTEHGYVKLNLADAEAVRAACAAMPGVAAIVVQPMIGGDLEAIAGIASAPGAGRVLMVGLGGIHAEALRDAALVPLGSSRAVIADALDRTALGRILRSARWKHPDARAALIETLVALRDFGLAAGDTLDAVDINPLVIGAQGVIAVDALVIARAGDGKDETDGYASK